jgi:hypothetical protein
VQQEIHFEKLNPKRMAKQIQQSIFS